MATINKIPTTYLQPQTAASTSDQLIAFDSNQYSSITVSADNLAGAETVQLLVVAGVTTKQITDIYAVAINLTASIPAVCLEGGPQYVFNKSVTAGACGIYINPNLAR